ncbi:MAG: TonB family protein [Pseudoxanthomonas sp.]|nr:TonB family protein [Pseudoxanthomonas sp.]
MVRALPHATDTRIDSGRIAALAAAIAVHAIALLMLLMPMAAPPIEPVALDAPKDPIFQIYEKKVLPDPVPVIEERKIVPEKKPDVIQKRTDVVTPVVDTPVIVEGGSEPVIEQSMVDTGAITGPALGGPLPSATLEYVRATSPRYPINELRKGVQGTVLLRVLVDVDGTPVSVTVESSSGNRNLDKAALQHVLKTWRFKPAMQDGQAVQAYGLVPIAFSLQ